LKKIENNLRAPGKASIHAGLPGDGQDAGQPLKTRNRPFFLLHWRIRQLVEA
jgi:hypothetical protein